MAGDSAFVHGPILVPVDFSTHSEAALRWALDFAVLAGAAVHVLHVVHDPAAAPGYYARQQDQDERGTRTMEEVARRLLTEFLDRCVGSEGPQESGVELKSSVLVGLPATRIIEIAERLDARLIVVGSQGRTGMSSLLLGSKAERVVRMAPMPVTVVKVESEGGSR